MKTIRIDVTHVNRLLTSAMLATDSIQAAYGQLELAYIELADKVEPPRLSIWERVIAGGRVMVRGLPPASGNTKKVEALLGEALVGISVLRGTLHGASMAVAGNFPIPADAEVGEATL